MADRDWNPLQRVLALQRNGESLFARLAQAIRFVQRSSQLQEA